VIVLVQVINTFAQILVWVVILSVILSYFMDPYHPVRRGLNSVVEPMLAPIRRVVPPVGMIDFSPLILIVLIQLIKQIIISLLI
jgi:YggT family protein